MEGTRSLSSPPLGIHQVITKLPQAHLPPILLNQLFLHQQGIEKWRQQELAAMGDIAFRFAEKQQPMSYVTSIARSMHQYHGGEVLRAPYVAHEFNAQLFKNLADILSPSNMLVFAVSPDATVKNASMFYHTPCLLYTSPSPRDS